MSILEKIYESYIAGDLSIKLENNKIGDRKKISEFQTKCGMTQQQISEFDELLLDTVSDHGKEMFFAGIKIAVQFMKEIAMDAESENKGGQ